MRRLAQSKISIAVSHFVHIIIIWGPGGNTASGPCRGWGGGSLSSLGPRKQGGGSSAVKSRGYRSWLGYFIVAVRTWVDHRPFLGPFPYLSTGITVPAFGVVTR